MATPKIAINGFGRIGRTVLRIAKQRRQFDVVAVNDLVDPERLAHAFKYDSVHGRYDGEVSLDGENLRVNNETLQTLSEPDPAKLPWKELGIDYVVEATGRFRKLDQLQSHLDAGARRVLLTVPAKDELKSTVVLGVNDHVITADAKFFSNASCTTNCAAPLAHVLHQAFGVRRGLLTTVHAYTAAQRLVDAPHRDFRRSRHAAINIIPTSTGAARAVGMVLPELDGRLDGLAMRVPVPNGSLVDFTLELDGEVTEEMVNRAFREAAAGDLAGIVQYEEDPIVSSDIIGNPHSCIFDAALTQVMGGNMVKVVAWYDNEYGYSARVVDLLGRMAALDGLDPSFAGDA